MKEMIPARNASPSVTSVAAIPILRPPSRAVTEMSGNRLPSHLHGGSAPIDQSLSSKPDHTEHGAEFPGRDRRSGDGRDLTPPPPLQSSWGGGEKRGSTHQVGAGFQTRPKRG